MKIYENLWGLAPGTLTDQAPDDKRLLVDAQLGAKVIRVYSKDWLDGAGRFAVLLAPYLMEEQSKGGPRAFIPLLDSQQAGEGSQIPDGMTEMDPAELGGAVHPADDPAITGFDETLDGEEEEASSPAAGQPAEKGGKKNNFRSPSQYTELMKSVLGKVSEDELIIRYYRERALPYLIKFPVKRSARAADPMPEGLELWDAGQPFGELDWVESAVRSPVIIPGVTTYQRTYGATEGFEPDKTPVDLYVGIDCSGSMANPKFSLSYPVLAGTIVAMSALRASAKVMACLSGEPGKFIQTDGFIRSEKEALKLLTGYLGTGYSYGVERLRETFLKEDKLQRPAHLLIITDMDIFHMLDSVKDGWEVLSSSVEKAGGGGTFVLNIPGRSYQKQVEKIVQRGWDVHPVSSQEEMLEFARKFSKRMYDKSSAGGGKP